MQINDLKTKIEGNALSLATVSLDGTPHCIVVGFCKIVDGKIVITDNCMVETTKNIVRNPRVSIALYSRDWENDCWGFELRGKAEYFKEGGAVDFVRKLKENKDAYPKGAIVVTVDKIKKLA